jgi:hypothetical protein
MDTFYRSPLSPSILVNACLTACFCPADHQTAVVSSQTQLDELMDSAPCTTRGDGAEERAKAWGTRCRMEVSKAGLDFERDALVHVARFCSSGMTKGSLVVSGPTMEY